MKVLQVNCVYPHGSTGKIVDSIHEGLIKMGHSSVVCYGRGKTTPSPYTFRISSEFYARLNKVASMVTAIPYGGCYLSTRRLEELIEKENPDVVHLHCINGNFVNIYKLISWLAGRKTSTVLTLHAEFFYTGNCAHAFDCEKWTSECGKCKMFRREMGSIFFDGARRSFRRMKRAFEGFGEENLTVVAVSPWLHSRVLQSKILQKKRSCSILNGVDVDIFRFSPDAELRSGFSPFGEKIVLHVTAFFDAEAKTGKGGGYVVDLARRMEGSPVRFLVVANESCSDFDAPDNLVMLGRVLDQGHLAKLYSISDATLLTSRRETFSMPCAESLCCGTPVVGFESGGPESISLNEFSSFVNYGDIDLLEAELRSILKRSFDRERIMDEAKEKYSSDKMLESYLEVYSRRR